MRARLSLVFTLGVGIGLGLAADAFAQRRPITIDDQFTLQDVGSPELSPDGEWVLYTVTTTDLTADRRNTDVWLVKWDGTERRQLTFSPENETSPKWSKRLALVRRHGDDGADGPEDRPAPGVGGGGTGGGAGAEAGPGGARPKPIVIDGYQFKRDGQTYLSGNARTSRCSRSIRSASRC